MAPIGGAWPSTLARGSPSAGIGGLADYTGPGMRFPFVVPTLPTLLGGPGTLEWQASHATIVAVTIGLCAVWIATWLPLRGPSGWGSRALEALLLGVALGGIGWALAGPEWVQDGERVEEGRMVVLVDASRSMGVLEPDGRPRSAAVAGLLDAIGPAEVYSFGDLLRPGAPSVFEDGDSDLGGALDALSRKYAGERLAGIAVLSDGIDRGGLRQRVMAGGAPPGITLGGPLTVYQIGTAQGRTDLAVDDVRAGAFAFLRSPFALDVDVHGVGSVPSSVVVSLTRDGQPAGTATAKLGADGKGTAHFSITPDRAGRFLYEASVPLLPGDAVPANQQMGLAVSVVRDRVRVLQVCGAPSWDQKFLRLFLKEDDAIDLVSFFILRTNRDMNSGYSENELSLIQFPYQNLFDRELSSFDLVIFQNFDYAPYFDARATELLGNVADYVKNGGAFVMLGGDRSFDLGGYAGTPIADILPVSLLGADAGASAIDEHPVVPRLTQPGSRHPVTQLTGNTADNALAWSQLAPMDGVNLVAGAAPGAAVLLEHPTLKGRDGKPMPILAIRDVGKGRTMALTADASWRWSFGEAGKGEGNQAYLQFWKSAMRWLIGDPANALVTVQTGRENYAPGEPATALVRVRDVTYAPVRGTSVSAQVSGPEGTQTLTATTDDNGEARLDLPTTQRGAHRVRVSGAAGEAQTVYGVSTRDPELDEVNPDATFLQAFAVQEGGKYVAPGSVEAPTRDPSAGRHVRDRHVLPLGTHPAVGAIVALSAALGWLVRRRSGRR